MKYRFSDALGIGRQGGSLSKATATALNLDPSIVNRPAMLPVARDKNGELMAVWPQMAIDAVQAYMLPGHAVSGGQYDAEDVANLALGTALAGAAARYKPQGLSGAITPSSNLKSLMYDETGSVPRVPGTKLPLPMDYESRMARAKEMGFAVDKPVYHGTSALEQNGSDFVSMQPNKGLFGKGVYFSNDPETASGYSGIDADGSRVIKAFLPINEMYDGMQHVNANGVKRLLRMLGVPEASHGQILRDVKPYRDRLVADDILHQASKYIDVDKKMLELGWKGLRYNVGQGSEVNYVVYDPTAIRSAHAQFDPGKASSSDILAGIGLSGALLPTAYSYLMQQQREGKM